MVAIFGDFKAEFSGIAATRKRTQSIRTMFG
jgi:hypothetical protein